MEKKVQISILCQIYSKMLTDKQLEIITDYYDNDLSLSEIAENNKITRQAVRDNIKKEWCKKNNIKLIEIPYWDFDKINEDYIKSKL